MKEIKTLKKTTEQFIEQLHKIHNNKYDYQLVKYNGFDQKVIIICPIHGKFKQRSKHHLEGKQCQQCVNSRIINTKYEFIQKARQKYGDLYDYSQIQYINSKKYVKIICKYHGPFKQTPNNHLNSSCGCKFCVQEQRRLLKFNNQTFVQKVIQKFGSDKYNLSLCQYINAKTKVSIICSVHGLFKSTPQYFIQRGCSKCPIPKIQINISDKKQYLNDQNKITLIDSQQKQNFKIKQNTQTINEQIKESLFFFEESKIKQTGSLVSRSEFHSLTNFKEGAKRSVMDYNNQSNENNNNEKSRQNNQFIDNAQKQKYNNQQKKIQKYELISKTYKSRNYYLNQYYVQNLLKMSEKRIYDKYPQLSQNDIDFMYNYQEFKENNQIDYYFELIQEQNRKMKFHNSHYNNKYHDYMNH